MHKHIAIISDLFQFTRKPTYLGKDQSIAIGPNFLAILILAIVVTIANNILIIPVNLLNLDAEFKMKEVEYLLHQSGWLSFILAGIIIFPVLEEIIFRYHLKFIIGSAVFYIALITTFLCTLLIKLVDRENAAICIFISFCFALIALLLIVPQIRTKYKYRILFIRYFHYHIWISAFFFAAIHIWNYDLHSTTAIILSPILVLPQLFGGLVLSYARLRFGILSAMIVHGLNNLLLFGFIYLGQ